MPGCVDTKSVSDGALRVHSGVDLAFSEHLMILLRLSYTRKLHIVSALYLYFDRSLLFNDYLPFFRLPVTPRIAPSPVIYLIELNRYMHLHAIFTV